jgi:hypothetical protein
LLNLKIHRQCYCHDFQRHWIRILALRSTIPVPSLDRFHSIACFLPYFFQIYFLQFIVHQSMVWSELLIN